MFSFKDYLLKLLTNKELKVLKKRFTIIQLLKSNLTYRKIAQKTGISTTTVVRLNQRLKIRKFKKKNYMKKPTPMPKNVYIKKQKLPWKIG